MANDDQASSRPTPNGGRAGQAPAVRGGVTARGAGNAGRHADDATSILQKIGKAARSLVELEVITAVGDFPVSLDTDGRLTFQSGQIANTDLLVTRIDLAQGDITNYIDPSFLTGDRAPLREFHERQVAQATAIMDRNVRVFTELARAFGQRLEDVIKKADIESGE